MIIYYAHMQVSRRVHDTMKTSIGGRPRLQKYYYMIWEDLFDEENND